MSLFVKKPGELLHQCFVGDPRRNNERCGPVGESAKYAPSLCRLQTTAARGLRSSVCSAPACSAPASVRPLPHARLPLPCRSDRPRRVPERAASECQWHEPTASTFLTHISSPFASTRRPA